MTRTRNWNAAVHDPILSSLIVQWKLDDPEAAERMGFPPQTVELHRQRLGLKRNRKTPVQPAPAEQSRPAPSERPNPVDLALNHFGKRVVVKASGYWLDGMPVSSHTLMRRYNQARVSMGQQAIPGPESWRP